MLLKSPNDFVLNEDVSFEKVTSEDKFYPIREILTSVAIKYQLDSLDTDEAYMWLTLDLKTFIVAYLHSDNDIWYLDLSTSDMDIEKFTHEPFGDLESLQAYLEDIKLFINSKSRM